MGIRSGALLRGVRGRISLEEAREAFMHVVDAALLGPLARAAVPQDVVHVCVAFIRGQLDGAYALGEVLELRFPTLDDFL